MVKTFSSYIYLRKPKTDFGANLFREYKIRIVKKLQGYGEKVAMAGAGIDDALALVHAKIGTVTGSMVTKVVQA